MLCEKESLRSTQSVNIGDDDAEKLVFYAAVVDKGYPLVCELARDISSARLT